MDRRSFLKAPAAAATAALVVREDGKAPLELDLAVLHMQAGDVLVLSVPGSISQETSTRLTACFEARWPQITVLVLGDGMKVDGVLRGLA